MINKTVLEDKLFNAYAGMYFFSMQAFEKRSAESKRQYQFRKIRALLEKAARLPIYQKKFADAGVSPEDFRELSDLTKFPVLTKEEYRSWMQEELKTEEAKLYKTTRTSGSTGIPTVNIYPPKEYAHHYMADFFGWWMGGYNPFTGLSLTRQPGDAAVGQRSLIQKLGILRRECFDTHWDRQRIVERINEVKPDFILANSSELLYIAQYVLDKGLEMHKPRFFCPTGENIDGRTEKLLTSVYGKGLINIYGGTEMADFAVKRPGSKVYRIIESLVAVCVREDTGELKMHGKGSILVTPLFRERYPLINYELGDYVELGERKGNDCIFRIKGRCNDIFNWKSGKQTIFMRLYEISEKLEDIFQIRFIQKSYEQVLIQAVKDPKSEKSEEELEQYLLEQFRDQFDTDTRIVIEWKDVLPPDKNGKIRIMSSEL
ncbi:MAG: phenylacetate--CoA ligase family protein [Lachnospiraceae bacterium]|nr:phenylacetate--CoA ligase family protein [Lachnospiraceae bacterium]